MRNVVDEIRNKKPGIEAFRTIRKAYGTDFSIRPAGLALLHAMVMRSKLPVLEIGSGVSTLVLGLAAQAAGLEVYTIETDDAYLAKAQSMAGRSKLGNVRLHQAVSARKGATSWPEGLPKEFGVALFDGEIDQKKRKAAFANFIPFLGSATIFVDECSMMRDEIDKAAEQLDKSVIIVNDNPSFALLYNKRARG